MRGIIFYVFLFLTVFSFGFSVPVRAEEAKINEADVAKAEAYLRDLQTAQARFVQTTHDGNQLVGTFYLNRPGKLRFQYDPPVEDFIVADGVFIYFYDGELKEQTNAPISTTLANFFLRKDFSLHGDVTVKDMKKSGGFLQIQVSETEDPFAGSLTLAFSEDPFTLKKWRVIDPQGLITEVELFYLKSGVTFPDGLFTYKDPLPGAKING
jgi:outer membrane lipoprotein-sorting protein